MNQDKNYTIKIANLIEALSRLSGEDLEEAKTVLREAGKDPEKILNDGIERLQKIQSSVRKKLLQPKEIIETENNLEKLSGILTFNDENNLINLEDINDRKSKVLNVNEVFDIFLSGKNIKYSKNEFLIDAKVKKIKFNRILREIIFNIKMQEDYAQVEVIIKRRSEIFQLNAVSLESILETGYLVFDNVWYPIDADSINFAKTFISQIINNRITLRIALDLFSKRMKLRWIKFQSEELNLDLIFKSNSFSPASELFIRELYNYQKDGVKWLQYCIVNKIGGILGDDMGLGKTAQTIALISWIIEKNILDNILIVVPGTLLENWKREFAFFAPSLSPFIHHGNKRSGSVLFLKEHNVVITSYSMIINDVYLFDKITWGLILLDEASLIKNPESDRRLALKQIPSEVRIAMSGTPVENSLLDLWTLADFVFPNYLGTREEFSGKYIKKDIQNTLANSNLSELKNDVSQIMLRRKKEDVLDSLPEKIDIHQALIMNQNEGALYEEQRNKILDQNDKHGGHVFKLIQDLRQYTTHPFLINGSEISKADISELKNSSVKFTRTIELLDDIYANGEKAIVFTEYLDMIDAMKRVFTEKYKCKIYTIDGRIETQERQINIDKFSATEKFSIMILNPKTAAMGLNITAANHVIHYTRQWNPALEEQSTARSYRNGQQKGVNVYYLYYANTIEEIIDERLRAKSALSGEVITVTDDELSIEEYISALSKSPIN